MVYQITKHTAFSLTSILTMCRKLYSARVLFAIIICIGFFAHPKSSTVQTYDLINYNLNGTPVNGIKIKTQIPFVNSGTMPTVRIEGFFYGEQAPVGIDIVWYVFNNTFTYARASSWGATTPPIYLSNENGYICLFIQDKPYFPRFHVSAFAKGMSQENVTSFSGWTIADEPLGGTEQTPVSYVNRFTGTVTIGNNYYSSGDVFLVATGPSGQFFRVSPTGFGVSDSAHLTTLQTRNYLTFSEIQNTAGKPLVLQHLHGGNVLIGKTSQTNTSYRLDVNGNVRANKVVVNTTGADYVFDSAYQMLSIDSLDAYVGMHHHLPGIPAADSMQKNGMEIGEMQTQLLQKVEELSLYVIQLQKVLREQDKKIHSLTNQLISAEHPTSSQH